MTPLGVPKESVLPVNTQDTIPLSILNVSQQVDLDLNNEELTQGDLHTFYNLKTKKFKNPCIAYLNINSLRGDKFTQLKEMMSFVKPEILCIDETKTY